MRGTWLALSLAAVFATAACTPLLTPTPPSRFYLLEPLETPSSSVGGAGLGIGPIRLAEYLDRAQIVTRRGEHALDLAEFDRWGEPLRESITRILAANLSALLATDRVQRHPFRDPRGVDVQVEVDVQRFDGPAEGPVELVAHWRVRRRGGSVDHVARIREPLDGSGFEAQAAAMSRALQALCREIAQAASARE